jgi:glycosyltransferase involved in cell wall biosynthesis
MKKILLIEICNYEDYPIGGYLSFAKQMIASFDEQLYLVGMSTDELKIGEWTKKVINQVEYNYFSVRKVKKKSSKPLIPGRLKTFYYVWKYRDKIMEIGIKNIFIQTPEVLLSIGNIERLNVCCRIPGTENSLEISRYWYAKYFASIFDYFFFKKLKKVKIILATANLQSIDAFCKRSKGIIIREKIKEFPTMFNPKIFFPFGIKEARRKINLAIDDCIIVTTGRLSVLKGWQFMIDAFNIFNKIHPNSRFYFLGDGEEKNNILKYLQINEIKNVFITGRLSQEDLSFYLNSANIYIMGSYFEGWSTSLVEAIACGKPVVTTNFSSAKELIENDVNGYVIENRDVDKFAESMSKAFVIPQKILYEKAENIKKYSIANLKNNILDLWELS